MLLHWRTPGQARWAPILDTKQLRRLVGGRKDESYWPVAVAQDKFHCIILKGGDRYPYFPRPLLSEFELRVPLRSAAEAEAVASADAGSNNDDSNNNNDDAALEAMRLEEAFVRYSLQLGLLDDLYAATRATPEHSAQLARQQAEVDKVLLQLLALECREGEERSMKALEIAGLLRDRSGRMLEAAGKIAARYARTTLAGKIRELAEERLAAMEED